MVVSLPPPPRVLPQTFYIWTGVSSSCLQLFCCIFVDEFSPTSPFHGRWLVHDMTQKCFVGPHLRRAPPGAAAPLRRRPRSRPSAYSCVDFILRRYLLGVGVPGLVLICAAVPAWIIFVRFYAEFPSRERRKRWHLPVSQAECCVD